MNRRKPTSSSTLLILEPTVLPALVILTCRFAYLGTSARIQFQVLCGQKPRIGEGKLRERCVVLRVAEICHPFLDQGTVTEGPIMGEKMRNI